MPPQPGASWTVNFRPTYCFHCQTALCRRPGYLWPKSISKFFQITPWLFISRLLGQKFSDRVPWYRKLLCYSPDWCSFSVQFLNCRPLLQLIHILSPSCRPDFQQQEECMESTPGGSIFNVNFRSTVHWLNHHFSPMGGSVLNVNPGSVLSVNQ